MPNGIDMQTPVPPPSPPSPESSDEAEFPCSKHIEFSESVQYASHRSVPLERDPWVTTSSTRAPQYQNVPTPEHLFDPSSFAAQIMHTQSQSLANMRRLYVTDSTAINAFNSAIALLSKSLGDASGKIVLSGMGKSGLIARKLCSSLNSLRLPSCFMHPVDALHGDMGILQSSDVLIFITYSGSTSEILNLLPHLRSSQSILIISGCVAPEACSAIRSWHELGRDRDKISLLPAPVHEDEQSTYGFAAPTTSTTCALALGDALVMALASAVHGDLDQAADVFRGCHPGGAIGASIGASASKKALSSHTQKSLQLSQSCRGGASDCKRRTAVQQLQRSSQENSGDLIADSMQPCVTKLQSIVDSSTTAAELLLAAIQAPLSTMACQFHQDSPVVPISTEALRLIRPEDLMLPISDLESVLSKCYC